MEEDEEFGKEVKGLVDEIVSIVNSES